MTALALEPVQPDESDIHTVGEALPHIRSYLDEHADSVIRLVVAGNPQVPFVVPRGAVQLLAQVLPTWLWVTVYRSCPLTPS